MKAIRFDEPHTVSLKEVPDPEPPSGWARIRTQAAAICMTDFEVLRGGIAAAYPVIPGHEWSGVVDRVGSAADQAWVGRRVTGDNEITCLVCRYCRRGEWRRCPQYRQIGFGAPGAYAGYLVCPVQNLHHLPDSVSYQQGALLEPMGVGLAVAAMAEVRLGSTVIILGAGPIGLSCLAAVKASGGRRILCLDRRAKRLELARLWGAMQTFDSLEALEQATGTFHPLGTDVVIDATGQPDLLRLGMRLTRFGGTLVLAGYFGGCRTDVNPDVVHERNVRILGAGNNSGFTEMATLAAGDGLLRTEGMITHHYRLEDYRTALSAEQVESPDFIKGIFLF